MTTIIKNNNKVKITINFELSTSMVYISAQMPRTTIADLRVRDVIALL